MPRLDQRITQSSDAMIVALALGAATSSGIYLLLIGIFGSHQLEGSVDLEGEGVFYIIVLATLVLSLCYYLLARKLRIS